MQALTLSVMVVTLGFLGMIANAHTNTPKQISNQQIQRQDALNQALTTSPTVHIQMPTLEQAQSPARRKPTLFCDLWNHPPLQADEKVDWGNSPLLYHP